MKIQETANFEMKDSLDSKAESCNKLPDGGSRGGYIIHYISN